MIGWQELLVILVIAMLIFGTDKLKDIGKTLGTAVRDFREAMNSEPPQTKRPSGGDTKESAGPPQSH